jgi:hypothetical protein
MPAMAFARAISLVSQPHLGFHIAAEKAEISKQFQNQASVDHYVTASHFCPNSGCSRLT